MRRSFNANCRPQLSTTASVSGDLPIPRKGLKMTEVSERFAFYSKLFELHTNRIFDYHKERFNIGVLSIGGMLAYYGWLFTTTLGNVGKEFYPLLLIAPVAFSSVGLIHNHYVNTMIRKHREFLNFLEISVVNVAPKWEETKNGSHKLSAWDYFETRKYSRKKSARDGFQPIKRFSYLLWIFWVTTSALIATYVFCKGIKP
jgi:hypothetical protein